MTSKPKPGYYENSHQATHGEEEYKTKYAEFRTEKAFLATGEAKTRKLSSANLKSLIRTLKRFMKEWHTHTIQGKTKNMLNSQKF